MAGVSWDHVAEWVTSRGDFRRIAIALERLVELKEAELRATGVLHSDGPLAGAPDYVDEPQMAEIEAKRWAHLTRGGVPLPDGEVPFEG